jgi:hypothetical protein
MSLAVAAAQHHARPHRGNCRHRAVRLGVPVVAQALRGPAERLPPRGRGAGKEILACEMVGITVILPKPINSTAKAFVGARWNSLK